ncbi:hypothetical protein BG004_000622 [Podila humilis]|nr:hypothetical protein BG004_000622 [Podila humilis]
MDSTIYPDTPALRRVINRHTKENLIDIAIQWIQEYTLTRVDGHDNDQDRNGDSYMDSDDDDDIASTRRMTTVQYSRHVQKEYRGMRESGSKKRVADRILGVDWNLGLTSRQVADLDLSYYKEHAHLKTWKALKLDFKDQEYLLTGTIKAEWKEFIVMAILELFRASKVEEWPLAGKSPTSLADLLLRKESQGAISQYRLNQMDDNPLSHAPKKRKKEDAQEKYAQGMQDIEAVDIIKVARRDQVIATDFGPNTQPSLSRVDIQLQLPFTTQSDDFNLGQLTRQPFPIKITMEGTNVIAGLCSMIPLGLNKSGQSLPPFLSELHSMATNTLTVDLEEEEDEEEEDSVIVKFKPTVSEEQAHDILKAVADLKNQLPGVIESVHLGVNFSARSKGFTHGFTMLFKDQEALEIYDKSPEHVKVVTEIIRPNIEDILAFDYETTDYSSPCL